MFRALMLGTLAIAVAIPSAASAVVPLTKINEDTYTNPSSQHKTQVEPDTFSFGDTIVSVMQTGRFFDGGASNIAWSTSHDGGASWVRGVLPNTTVFEGGTWSRISDPVIAYDRRHDVWLASTLGIVGTRGAAVLISRSTDDGLTWGNPIIVSQTSQFYDKNWTACDNTPTSPFYGRCYTEWDNNTIGNRLLMSTSADGGLTWGPPLQTANSGSGLGGLPVVRASGEAIVPFSGNFGSVAEFRSTNGGQSWGTTQTIAGVSDHSVAGGLRSPPLPSVDVDAGGKVYVVWHDCRFRTGCSSNDIVLATNKRNAGRTWSAVTRIPIDPVNSGVDHFIPGLAVRPGTKGRRAHLALTYYYYPVAACNFSTCQLRVGFVESRNGGRTWTAPVDVAGPMMLSWIANTSSGRMVGDYISTSFNSTGGAHAAFAVANAPSGSVFDEATYTTAAPLFGLRAPDRPVTPADTVPVTHESDHPPYSLVTAY